MKAKNVKISVKWNGEIKKIRSNISSFSLCLNKKKILRTFLGKLRVHHLNHWKYDEREF